jgi:hypothetical protein
MDPDGCALALASKQGGVITRVQATRCGLTPSSIKHRLRLGRWEPVVRSVYRLIDMTDAHDLIRAAVSVLPDAVVSHEAAAEIHGIRRVRTGVPAVSVHSRTTHTFPGVAVHRNHDLAPSHIELHGDLPVTTLPRTVIDLASILHVDHVGDVVTDLITEKRLTVETLGDVFDEVACRGKPGSATIRWILETRGTGQDANASALERRGLAVLLDGGLPRPRLECAIPWDTARRFDACYPVWMIAIEWDSRRWHLREDAFERDRARDRSALLHGWAVYRFTWDDVTTRPDLVVSTIRSAVRQAQRRAEAPH